MRSCWRGGLLETLLWFPTGGAAIGKAVENVLPVVLAAEAFGEVKRAEGGLAYNSEGVWHRHVIHQEGRSWLGPG